MVVKVLILIVIASVGIYSTYRQYEKKNYKGIAWAIIGTITLGIFTNYLTDLIRPFLPYPDNSVTASAPIDDDNKGTNSDPKQTEIGTGSSGELGNDEDETNNADNTDNMEILPPKENSKLTQMDDISDLRSINGSLVKENQKDEYVYVAPTDGTYRFYADLSSGGEILIRLCDENGESLNYGTNALTINLEAKKTYILSVEYRSAPCDYIVNIGVPIAISDKTGKTSISGKITYQDQKDQYRYTTSTSGTYRFDTNLSAAGEVRIQIFGENGKSINYGINSLTIELEAGKTYILSVEYRNGPCDYTVNIGVPIAISNITEKTSISGNITYQDQKDKYSYTAAISGTYRFDTNLSSAGEVRVQIFGENGKSINYGINALTIDLEAGKTYVLSIEYRNGPCDYTVNIGVPIAISDMTGNTSISGKINFQDQKDRYYYTAPTNGTYRFDSNLSAGGEVRVRISGENGNSINYATNALTIDLEAGKTYILSVEYRNGPCDYDISVGVPIPITNITGYSSVTGNITYQDQKDKYYYTAPISGTYCFNTNLSAGGEVRVRISGENGNSLNYGTNTLTMNLEAGKTYILSVEYRNAPCSYVVLFELQ